MNIGIFGGTFDPPHKTHVAMAQCAARQLQLDKLIVVPCGVPPHKPCRNDKHDRLEMCRLAFGSFAEVDPFEMDGDGKSYTVTTLEHFKEIYPNDELFLIIGGDSLASFENWYMPRRIANLCTLAAAARGKDDVHQAAEKVTRQFGATVAVLQFEPDTVSSMEIRLRYQFGLDNSDFVTKSVDKFVRKKALYREGADMIKKLRGYLKKPRFEHTYHVVKRGLELCLPQEREKVFVACLLHDCAKYIPRSRQSGYGYVQPPDMPDSVVHSFLGAKVAQMDFGVTDEDILNAIAYHTTGRPGMSRLEKIVYIADKTEETRPYPTEHLCRGTLDEMFLACLQEAYAVCLEHHCDSVCPLSEQTVAYYGKELASNKNQTEEKS